MKKILILISLISISNISFSEEENEKTNLMSILESYSQRNNAKIIVDPTARNKIELLGQDIKEITYPELMTILEIHGFTIVKRSEYLVVIPNKSARLYSENVNPNKTDYLQSQYVTDVIKLKHECAAKIIPILRPLVPQEGHMAAAINSNAIVLTDTYSNLQRIKNIIGQLDSIMSEPEKCDIPKI